MNYSFYIGSQQHYHKVLGFKDNIVEEIWIGDFIPDGGTGGEWAILFYDLQGSPTARIEMFEDAWHLFRDDWIWQNLLRKLLRLNNPSPQEVIDCLLANGFKDVTERKNPNEESKKVCEKCGQEIK